MIVENVRRVFVAVPIGSEQNRGLENVGRMIGK
jgi:hypothetical protein